MANRAPERQKQIGMPFVCFDFRLLAAIIIRKHFFHLMEIFDRNVFYAIRSILMNSKHSIFIALTAQTEPALIVKNNVFEITF